MNAQVLPDRIDALWLDCNVATMAADAPYGAIEQAAIAVAGDCIAWVGPETQLPANAAEQSKSVHHLRGAWVTPGLVDCHTHLVYAGNRAHEFEMRLSGAAYEEIARAGGGIMSTVKSVRTATFEALYLASAARLEAMQRQGVTTVEIKSGYGLDPPNERKMLGVIRRLGQDFPVTVRSTFLGAHALPPEYKTCPDTYVEVVTREMLPAFKADNLVDAVDVFCEHIAFTPAQTEHIFQAATGTSGCGSSSTRINSAIRGAPHWPRDTTPLARITWNMSARRGLRPWPRQTRWPSSFPVPITF